MIKVFAEHEAINIPRWRKAGKMTEVVFGDEERARLQKIGGSLCGMRGSPKPKLRIRMLRNCSIWY